MWSGPRNLSTALMYSFAARGDFSVMDEPFYAPYLKKTGIKHPMHAEILAKHQTDPVTVAQACLAPQGKPHLYMKHMPHHMIAGFPMDWAERCVNVHLIRHPARVIASYAEKWQDLTLDQIGFVQQTNVFERVGGVVIDSDNIRNNPEETLRRLCYAVDLPFDPSMLSWPAGPLLEDGVWAKHWYGAVHKSTGFAAAEGDLPKLEGHQRELMEAALPHYEALRARALN